MLAVNQPENCGGDLPKGYYLIHSSQLDRLARHTPHDTGLLVLSERVGPGLMHLFETARPVVAHAGEQHSHGIWPNVLRHRTKQDVHRGPMAVHWGAIVQPTYVAGTVTRHQ